MRKAVLLLSLAMVLFAGLVTSPTAEAQSGPYQFVPLSPCRIVDTRFGFGGALAGQLPTDPDSPRLFTVKGAKKFDDPNVDCGVPLTAKAVAVNVTIAGPTEAGFLSVWPAGIARPPVSTINFTIADYALANGAVVPLGAGTPDLAIRFGSWPTRGSVHFILDVNGYFQ